MSADDVRRASVVWSRRAMSVRSPFDGMPEAREALSADLDGRLLEATPGVTGAADSAAAAAAAVREFAAAGEAAGLTRLEMLLLKGSETATATAVRGNALLLVLLDPSKPTAQVEKALQAWIPPQTGAPAPPPLPARPAAATAPSASAPAARGAPAARAVPAPAPRSPPPPAPPAPGASAAAPSGTRAPEAARPGGAPADDTWAALRRALARGQLTEAAARQRELGEPSRAGSGRPGSEPLAAEERDRAIRILFEGVGSVMAGDGVGGGRFLGELAESSHPNLSFRWLALHWSARAALKSGNIRGALAHAKEALAVARQLDLDTQAVSQWAAAEVLAHDADPTRALPWLKESRSRFERLGDGWGPAQTWLTEARILASVQREPEASEAARQACAADPGWDEPPVFLARRAVASNELAEAEQILRTVETPAANRVRAVIDAIRQSTVSQADAAEFLREHDAPPSARAIKAIDRIARAWPGFVQAQEALGWMLLKVGRYGDASSLFRNLLRQTITPGVRASTMLGLSCIANAQQAGGEPDATLRAVAAAGASAPPATERTSPSPVPQLSSSSLVARSARAGNGGDAVFSGRLSVFALPDLLEFLRSARRTGLLVFSSATGMGALRFREGWITGASSPGTPGIGQMLLRARKISSLALGTVATGESAEQPDEVIGGLLVREGLVDAAAVQEAFRQQIDLTIRDLVRWKDGEFAFSREADAEADRTGISVAVDPQAVMLNVFKDMDEETRSAAATGARR
jgi:tetratricopeptide (TPR) repeat protein